MREVAGIQDILKSEGERKGENRKKRKLFGEC
jgi:hypothetical protein